MASFIISGGFLAMIVGLNRFPVFLIYKTIYSIVVYVDAPYIVVYDGRESIFKIAPEAQCNPVKMEIGRKRWQQSSRRSAAGIWLH